MPQPASSYVRSFSPQPGTVNLRWQKDFGFITQHDELLMNFLIIFWGNFLSVSFNIFKRSANILRIILETFDSYYETLRRNRQTHFDEMLKNLTTHRRELAVIWHCHDDNCTSLEKYRNMIHVSIEFRSDTVKPELLAVDI